VYGIIATLRERGDTLPAEVRRQLEDTLHEQSERLRRLIEQLLDLSRLDSRSIRIEPRLMSLAEFLPELADALGSQTTTVEVDDDVGEVVADPVALERILGNLLVNAHRYGEPPVLLTARRGDTHVRIVVEDEGPGIPAELEPRLFERFERGSLAGEGSGLGLAIARAYARAHGGDLVYDPGTRGARFEFLLPFLAA
jgi:signal transduction histidine kinase